jgi:hypothetical protein
MIGLEAAIGLTREARVLVDVADMRIVHVSSAVFTLSGHRFADLANQPLAGLFHLDSERMEAITARVAACARFSERVQLTAVGEPYFEAMITSQPVVASLGDPPRYVSIRIVRLVPADSMPMPLQLLDAEGRRSMRKIVATLPPAAPAFLYDLDGAGSGSEIELG